MKEASGEANMTVITILLIAIVGAVGTVIINSVLNNTKKSACCESDGGYWHGGTCYKEVTTGADGKTTYSTSYTPTCSEK